MKADFSVGKLNISLYFDCEKHKLNNKPAVDVQPVFAVFYGSGLLFGLCIAVAMCRQLYFIVD
ncbi:MAG: hypothetical protein J6K80_07725 [Oscillospiraceae bacterium]|nr:hypothetical protein [Oscillospiraceae bacterium]